MTLLIIIDIPPRTLHQPLWSSVASQSIASTQPIGSKPHTAATSTTHPISAWNTEHTPLQSCNGGSPNTMMNIRERKDNFYGEGQGDALKKQHRPFTKVQILWVLGLCQIR